MREESKKIIEESKKFKYGEMKDLGESPRELKPSENKKWYPSISIDELDTKGYDVGDDITLHAHCQISRIEKSKNNPKRVSIEIQKAAVKEGHNPFKSKAQQRFMFAAEARGELKKGTAKKWAEHTPNIKSLPNKVSKKKKKRGKKK